MKFDIKLEHINYLVLFCKDKNNNLISIKAGFKSKSDSEIIVFTKYSDDYANISPQNILANIICKEGIYSIKTTLKEVEKASPYIIYILKNTDEIDFKQNREYFRINYSTECLCQTNTQDSITENEGKIVNLSANGIKAVFPVCFITNGNCNIIFSIENKKLNLNSRYIRSELVDGLYYISFSFIKISNQDRDFISQFCIKKQLEEKRKNLF